MIRLSGKLVKILESIGVSYGMTDIEYYLHDDKVIFISEVEKHFSTNKKNYTLDHNKLNGSTGICVNTVYKISFRRQRRIIFVDIQVHRTLNILCI